MYPWRTITARTKGTQQNSKQKHNTARAAHWRHWPGQAPANRVAPRCSICSEFGTILSAAAVLLLMRLGSATTGARLSRVPFQKRIPTRLAPDRQANWWGGAPTPPSQTTLPTPSLLFRILPFIHIFVSVRIFLFAFLAGFGFFDFASSGLWC